MTTRRDVPVAALRRELGVPAATALGLGSILGTGVFVAIAIVAGLAGPWTLLAILLAAGVALCNALSSAQLAAAYPRSGGTYEYGYELLSPLAGFLAGWTFLCAKSASAAAAALGFASYALEFCGLSARTGLRVALAACLIVALTALVAGGIRRSSRANAVIVSITLVSLLAFVVALLPTAWDGFARELSGARAGFDAARFAEAIALMFVAFTGYGRVATLGEEVRDPARTIPRAILCTLCVSAVIYMAVGLVAIGALGSERFADTVDGARAPLEAVAASFTGATWLAPLVAIGAATAMLGVLLNLLLGLSRVMLAMARRRDMPAALARLEQNAATPRAAVVVVGAIVLTIAVFDDLAAAWSFSAFTVFLYYGLTNLAALRLPPAARRYSRVWAWLGLLACIGLATQVERNAWLAGSLLLVAGCVWALFARWLRSPR